MSYLYSTENRLQNSCSYMYTPFEGTQFLTWYLEARRNSCIQISEALQTCNNVKPWVKFILERISPFWLCKGTDCTDEWEAFGTQLLQLLKLPVSDDNSQEGLWWQQAINEMVDDKTGLETSILEEHVATDSLFFRLVVFGLSNATADGIRDNSFLSVMGYFLQRFELTKKIYPEYEQGLRKGAGDPNWIPRYGIFAVQLVLAYESTGNTRWLNSLLKVNDLLCSVLDQFLEDAANCAVIQAALLAEVAGVRLLMHKGGLG